MHSFLEIIFIKNNFFSKLVISYYYFIITYILYENRDFTFVKLSSFDFSTPNLIFYPFLYILSKFFISFFYLLFSSFLFQLEFSVNLKLQKFLLIFSFNVLMFFYNVPYYSVKSIFCIRFMASLLPTLLIAQR